MKCVPMLSAVMAACVVITTGARVSAQTSSLGAQQRKAVAELPPAIGTRETPQAQRNYTYEKHAWISLPPLLIKQYKVGDLLTIIVREQKSFEAESDLETKRRYDVKSELDDFLKFTDGGVGAAAFRRGQPNINYKFDTRQKSEGDTSREDRFTTRITSKIIDVKPNGLLVVEAVSRVEHDEEIAEITLTGTCRKEDVTADNTVLSTQIADKNVVIRNKGALRSASSRGWLSKLFDKVKPF